MSLLGFQRALADLSASPDLCSQAIADPNPVLAPYDLTERERARLAAMVRHRLMATNCVLYRANRITPVYVFFPMTCRLLGRELRSELDAFWRAAAGVDLQYYTETARFARFLRERIASGELRNEYLAEIVDYEAAATELRFAGRNSDDLRRRVRFTHDPAPLLDALSSRAPIPPGLARGEYEVLLDAANDTMEVSVCTAACESR